MAAWYVVGVCIDTVEEVIVGRVKQVGDGVACCDAVSSPDVHIRDHAGAAYRILETTIA